MKIMLTRKALLFSILLLPIIFLHQSHAQTQQAPRGRSGPLNIKDYLPVDINNTDRYSGEDTGLSPDKITTQEANTPLNIKDYLPVDINRWSSEAQQTIEPKQTSSIDYAGLISRLIPDSLRYQEADFERYRFRYDRFTKNVYCASIALVTKPGGDNKANLWHKTQYVSLQQAISEQQRIARKDAIAEQKQALDDAADEQRRALRQAIENAAYEQRLAIVDAAHKQRLEALEQRLAIVDAADEQRQALRQAIKDAAFEKIRLRVESSNRDDGIEEQTLRQQREVESIRAQQAEQQAAMQGMQAEQQAAMQRMQAEQQYRAMGGR